MPASHSFSESNPPANLIPPAQSSTTQSPTTQSPTTQSSTTQSQQTLEHTHLGNRSLKNILFLYQQAGYHLVFSDQLITDNSINTYNVPANDPIKRLQIILARFNLGLKKNTALNAWLVVKQPADVFITLTIRTPSQQPISLEQLNKLELLIDNHPFNFTVVSSEKGQVQVAIHSALMHSLSIKLKGYASQTLSLNTAPKAVTIELQPLNTPAIEETLVTASFYALHARRLSSQNNLDGIDLRNTPTRGNDPIQAIAKIPGVANSGVSAKPNIRGGASDELLILIDGVELNEPFHLKDFQGLLSGINNQLVNTIDVYTGGYPARYGSKMSGVMDISTIEPNYINNNKNNNSKKSGNNQLAINTLYNAITLSDWGNGARDEDYYVFATRRGHLETVLQQVNPELGTPRFNDTFAKYHWQKNETTFYEGGVYALRDDIRLFESAQKGGPKTQNVSSIYNSHYAWLKMHSLKNAFTHQWQAIYNYNKNNRQGIINEGNNPASSQGQLKDQRNIKALRLNYDGQYALNEQANLAFGGTVHYTKADYQFQAVAKRGELANILGVEPAVDFNINTQPQGFLSAAYASYQTQLTKRWFIEGGLRFESQSFTQKTHHQISPRLAVNYSINNHWRIKSSAGRFYQAPNIYDLAVNDGETAFYKPQKSDHYISGIEFSPNKKLSASIELYLKKIFAPKTRYQNLINPYVLLPELAPDRIAITPSQAKAKGIELSANYNYQPNINVWATFAFGEAEDTVDGIIVPRSWNQTRSLQIGGKIEHQNWQFNTQLLWRSGSPYTQLPSFTEDLQTPIAYTRNNRNFSDYLSIDIHLSRTWALSHSQLQAYIDVTNATNTNNPGFNTLTITPAILSNTNANNNANTSAGYNLQQTPQNLFPIIPTIGIEWHF